MTETTEPTPANLNGNDAIEHAAAIAKHTAQRNISSLGDLPIAADTANLRFGPNLHDGLLALLPLIGVWRGQGRANFTYFSEPLSAYGECVFGQELTFSHDGENYLSYVSKIWIPPHEEEHEENDTPDSSHTTPIVYRETGFWRITPKDDIEVLAVHASGVMETFYGHPLNERAWQIDSASTMVTETGPTALGPGKRLYGLMPNGSLGWVDERRFTTSAQRADAAQADEFTPWMSAELERYAG